MCMANEVAKAVTSPDAGPAQVAKNAGAAQVASAAPVFGRQQRNSSAMGAGSLLTGPSGIANNALAMGKTTLLGQ